MGIRQKQARVSEEVYHSITDNFELGSADIQEIIKMASATERQRVRLCTHKSKDSALHQMFIAHSSAVYVRPHKHVGKTESMLVLHGIADYIEFSSAGEVVKITRMGGMREDGVFYKTVESDLYHSMRIISDWLVFLEVTTGPFLPHHTVYADWSPNGSNANESINYIQNLSAKEI